MHISKILQGDFLAGRKTYILSIIGIISVIVAYMFDDIGLVEALKTIWALLLAMTLRNGMRKRK